MPSCRTRRPSQYMVSGPSADPSLPSSIPQMRWFGTLVPEAILAYESSQGTEGSGWERAESSLISSSGGDMVHQQHSGHKTPRGFITFFFQTGFGAHRTTVHPPTLGREEWVSLCVRLIHSIWYFGGIQRAKTYYKRKWLILRLFFLKFNFKSLDH